MISPSLIRRGLVCRHHKGGVYTVDCIANTTHPSEKFPATVIYVGANGAVWARPMDEFVMKFDVLHDGTRPVDP